MVEHKQPKSKAGGLKGNWLGEWEEGEEEMVVGDFSVVKRPSYLVDYLIW